MKDFIRNLTKKQIILAIIAAISLVLFLLLTVISSVMKNGLESQNMAKRWSKDGGVAQISCFISQGTEFTENNIWAFEHALDGALTEAAITLESENPSARLWADAYSASGRVNLVSSLGKMDVNAIGIGGDFFLFHPLNLLNGSFFSGADLMQDYVILDEDAAWQLFGSNDVVGMEVTISGIPHMVSGVIKRDTGRMNDKAGNGNSTVYVSYQTLTKYGIVNNGINHYELVMPNPVDEFAIGIVKDKIGLDEKIVEITENSTRYNLLPLLKVLGGFGTRSMNGKAIIYPYWENIARGYEDILALVLLFRMLCLLYPIVIFIIFIIYLWKHKTWTFKDVKKFLEQKIEQHREKQREKKLKDEEEFE